MPDELYFLGVAAAGALIILFGFRALLVLLPVALGVILTFGTPPMLLGQPGAFTSAWQGAIAALAFTIFVGALVLAAVWTTGKDQ